MCVIHLDMKGCIYFVVHFVVDALFYIQEDDSLTLYYVVDIVSDWKRMDLRSTMLC